MFPRFMYMFIPIFGPHFYASKRRECYANSFFAVETSVNRIMDKLLAWVQKYFKENGFDPYPLEDSILWNRTIKFPYEVEWKNVFGVYSGEILNLSTLHRNDDASLEYAPESNVFELRGRVAFDKIQIIYDFAAKIMNLGPRGHLVGIFPSLRARYAIEFSATTLTTELKAFDLDETKEFYVTLEGFGLLNEWILLLVLTILDQLKIDYKGMILNTLEEKLRTNLENALKGYKQNEHGTDKISVDSAKGTEKGEEDKEKNLTDNSESGDDNVSKEPKKSEEEKGGEADDTTKVASDTKEGEVNPIPVVTEVASSEKEEKEKKIKEKREVVDKKESKKETFKRARSKNNEQNKEKGKKSSENQTKKRKSVDGKGDSEDIGKKESNKRNKRDGQCDLPADQRKRTESEEEQERNIIQQ